MIVFACGILVGLILGGFSVLGIVCILIGAFIGTILGILIEDVFRLVGGRPVRK